MVLRLLKLFAENRVEPAGQEAERRLQLAVCVLLLAVAHSDDRITEEEEERIVAILRQNFRLPAEYVSELLELARQKRKESVDLFRFTNIINNTYSPAEKERVIEALWKVIYADNRLTSLEDNLIHRLSRMLHLSHYQLIALKKRFLELD